MAGLKTEVGTLNSRCLDSPIESLSFLRQSLLFAELSRCSYFAPERFWPAAKSLGFEAYEFLDRDGAQAYIVANRFDCIVVCRGTEPGDWNDIKADANAVSVLADTAGRVHRGFNQEVDDLWPRLERSLKSNEKPLWFSGHSLGGAMATICAGRCKLAEIPSNPTALFTYGSPRVGSDRYINFVDIQHFRWVNNNDIVCRVPPTWFGYRHSGQEFYFDATGKLRSYQPWRRFRDSWGGFFRSLRRGQIDHFADHALSKYIEYLCLAIDDEAAGRLALRAG
jgi:triacylglycerol lipase